MKGLLDEWKRESQVMEAAEVESMMASDLLSRREGQWQMCGYQDIAEFRKVLVDEKQRPLGNSVTHAVQHSYAAYRSHEKWELAPERTAIEELYEKYPMLPSILALAPKNILVAGGSIQRVLKATNSRRQGYYSYHSPDIDLFLIGLDEFGAACLMGRIAKLFIGQCRVVHRALNVTTFEGESRTTRYMIYRKYQVVHRLFSSPLRCLGGFDLSCCSVGLFDGSIICTRLGAWSIANNVCICDISRRSLSFSYRLHKYAYQGYRLLLPGLNRRLVTNSINMAGLKVHTMRPYERGEETNQQSLFISGSLYQRSDGPQVMSEIRSPCESDYEPYDPERSGDADGWRHRCSLLAAAQSRLEGIIVEIKQPTRVGQIMEVPPLKPSTMDARKFIAQYHPDKRWAVSKVLKWFPDDGPFMVMAITLGDEEQILKVVRSTLLRIKRNHDLWRDKMKDYSQCWIKEDPSRQYSTSFNPAILKASEFYGPAWNGLNIGLSDDLWVTMCLIKRQRGIPADILKYLIQLYILARYQR